MAQHSLTDQLVILYNKIFPWRFRFRYGAPLIRSLMKLKDNSVLINGVRVFLNPNDKTATELFLVHATAGEWIWESYEISLFLECLKENKGSLAVDLGANYGAYSLSACPLVRDGSVRSIIAVEPNKETYSCLEKSAEFNGFSPCIHLINAAVTHEHNSACLFCPHDTFSAMSKATTIADDAKLPEHSSSYKVRGITLDALLPELGLTDIDSLVVKIDVEGCEPDAFQGMKNTLDSAKGYQVFFELHPTALGSLGRDPKEFARFLFGLGFDVMAEVDQHKKVARRVGSLDEFMSIVEECLATTEMWKDYTNIFISKGLKVPLRIV